MTIRIKSYTVYFGPYKLNVAQKVDVKNPKINEKSKHRAKSLKILEDHNLSFQTNQKPYLTDQS